MSSVDHVQLDSVAGCGFPVDLGISSVTARPSWMLNGLTINSCLVWSPL